MATLWIVGEWERDIFCEPVAFLDRGRQCGFFESPSAAARVVEHDGAAPRAIVIVQARPGEFSRGEVERLHAAAPLARIVALTGPWCEGEGRSGKPWPGVTRVAWRNWRGRLATELGLLTDGAAKELRLPRTATEAERIERSVLAARPRRFSGRADVYSSNRVTFEGLADCLAQFGLSALWRNGNEAEADRLDAPAVNVLDGWEQAAEAGRAPLVVVLDFPRPADVQRARERGMAAVLGRPGLIAEWGEVLGELLERRVEGRRGLVA